MLLAILDDDDWANTKKLMRERYIEPRERNAPVNER
jgi:hypothetical protein